MINCYSWRCIGNSGVYEAISEPYKMQYGVTLNRTVWHNANLRNSQIILMNFLNVDYSGADLRNTRFAQTYMNNTNFSGADLRGAIFDTSAFENADFRDANLEGIKYDGIALQFFAVSNLKGAKLSADLQKDLEKLRTDEDHDQ
jgi:uncharacterized protein YjbI with pentapeptide repeats